MRIVKYLLGYSLIGIVGCGPVFLSQAAYRDFGWVSGFLVFFCAVVMAVPLAGGAMALLESAARK